ncbi:MAG: hypothetical protein Q8R24_00410 [Legionellaceae bacterium]|nr:hypothetical protein [Legionellaceae bacterium]
MLTQSDFIDRHAELIQQALQEKERTATKNEQQLREKCDEFKPNTVVRDILIEIENLKAHKPYTLNYNKLTPEQCSQINPLCSQFIREFKAKTKLQSTYEILQENIRTRNMLLLLIKEKNIPIVLSKVEHLLDYIEQRQKKRLLIGDLQVATSVLNALFVLVTEEHEDDYKKLISKHDPQEAKTLILFLLFAGGALLLAALFSFISFLVCVPVPYFVIPMAIAGASALIFHCLLIILNAHRIELFNRNNYVSMSYRYNQQLKSALDSYSIESASPQDNTKNTQVKEKVTELLQILGPNFWEQAARKEYFRNQKNDPKFKSHTDKLIDDINNILLAKTEMAIDRIIAKYDRTGVCFYSPHPQYKEIAEKMRSLKTAILESPIFQEKQNAVLMY